MNLIKEKSNPKDIFPIKFIFKFSTVDLAKVIN